MEREEIKVSEDKWCDLVHELYFTDDEGKEIEIEEVQRNYKSSGRHTEYWEMIFKRVSDGKFFKINYENSVKDSMGWYECNYGDTIAIEVFPETQTITIYK